VEKTRSRKLFNFSLLRRVFHYAAPYKKQLYASVALAVLLAAVAPARPYLIQVTVDKYIANSLLRMVIYITIFQIGLLLVETVMRFAFSYISSWLGQAVIRDLRMDVYNKVIRQNLRFFDKTPIGTLTTRTINDIEAINDIFSSGLISIIADLLMILSILIVMLFTDWKLTLISLSVFPFLIFATYIFKESVNKSFIKVRNAVAALNAFVQEHITGMALVQAFAAEKREQKHF
jgi:ATP-binding cassette subfamily B protein